MYHQSTPHRFCRQPPWLATLSGSDRIAAAQQARVLLMPGEMGEVFKIMLLGRGETGALPPMTFRDFRSWL